MRRLTGLLLAAGLVSAGAAAAQKPPSFLAPDATTGRLTTRHLEAVVEGEPRVDAAGRATVSIRVTPAPKMHVYGPDVTGYQPFTLTVDPVPGVTVGRVVYPPSGTYVFPPTGESSRAYLKPFVVKQGLSLDAAKRRALAAGTPLTLLVTLRYQACDDRVCYRPASGTLSVDLTR